MAWQNPYYSPDSQGRTERYDYAGTFGSGIPKIRNFNQGLQVYNQYRALKPGDPGYDHAQAAGDWLTKKGFDPENPTAKQAFSALDWRFRDIERGNQKENFGFDDIAGFVGPAVGFATGNPWLGLAAGGLSTGAASGFDPLQTALGAAGGYFAGSSNLFGSDGFLGSEPGSLSNFFSGAGGAGKNALANAVPGGSSGITTPFGAGGLTTAQGAGTASVGGGMTLAGSGGASIGWNPLAVLGGAAAKSAGVANTAANLAKYANGTSKVPGTNQTYGPADKASGVGDFLKKAGGAALDAVSSIPSLPSLSPNESQPGYGGSPTALPVINALSSGSAASQGSGTLSNALITGAGGGGNSPQGGNYQSGAGAGRQMPQNGRIPGYQRRPFANYLMVA